MSEIMTLDVKNNENGKKLKYRSMSETTFSQKIVESLNAPLHQNSTEIRNLIS